MVNKKEFEIKILEDVSNGTLTTNDILRRLLLLYGARERYFYHHSYTSRHVNGNINTNELIECEKDTYDRIIATEENAHRPVKYMSDVIPLNKKLRAILYTK